MGTPATGVEPGNEKNTAIFSLLEKEEPLEIMVKFYVSKKAYSVLFTNPQEKIITGDYSLQSITGKNNGTYYNWTKKKVA